MANRENQPKAEDLHRQLLDVQFATYRRIVEKKHGITVPLTIEDAKGLTDEELQPYVDSLREMAHLPPQ